MGESVAFPIFSQIKPISAYFNLIRLMWGFFVRRAKNHISGLNVNTSEAIATDLMGTSLLKESLPCVKFYIHKIDSISVFVMKLKRILISAKGYLGVESLTTIIDKITWTNSEFNI